MRLQPRNVVAALVVVRRRPVLARATGSWVAARRQYIAAHALVISWVSLPAEDEYARPPGHRRRPRGRMCGAIRSAGGSGRWQRRSAGGGVHWHAAVIHRWQELAAQPRLIGTCACNKVEWPRHPSF